MAKSRPKKRRRPKRKRQPPKMPRPQTKAVTAIEGDDMSQYRIRSLQPKEVYQLDGVNLKILTAIARQLDLPDSMIPLQIPYPFDAIPWRLVDDRTLAQLSEEEEVEFNMVKGPKGYQAEEVKKLSSSSSS